MPNGIFTGNGCNIAKRLIPEFTLEERHEFMMDAIDVYKRQPVIDSRMYMVEVGNGEGAIGAGGYYPCLLYTSRCV